MIMETNFRLIMLLDFKGLKALHSPHTGIVDWGRVTEHFGKDFMARGGKAFLNFEVNQFREANDGGSEEGPVVLSSKQKVTFDRLKSLSAIITPEISSFSGSQSKICFDLWRALFR